MALIVIGAVVVIGIIALVAGGGNCSCTTASLSEATMATAVDNDGRPVGATGVFAPGTPEIYCSAILSNAPPDTEIKAEWVYIQGEADATNALITDSSMTADGTRYVYFSVTAPDTGWPRGDYKVVLYIDGKEQLSVPFSVQ